MSDIVHYRGILYEVHPQNNETIQETAERLFNEGGHKVSDYSKEFYRGDWVRTLCAYAENYFLFNYKLYIIKKEELDPNDDIISASFNEDGSIDFELKYYNGGASMQEALESAMKKLNL